MADAALLQAQADRAVATYAAMQRCLYASDGTSLYREVSPWSSGNPYAYVWPFSRALIGTLSLAGVPESRLGGIDYRLAVADRLVGLARYWNGSLEPPAYDSYVRPPLGQGGDRYYDDNAWIALALVELYQLRLTTSLRPAQRVFEFARSGWSQTTNEPAPGGVFWVEQGLGQGQTNHDRGAGLNAGYAKLGFLLHELTGSADFDGDGALSAQPRRLGALNMLNWVDACLDSRQSGSGPYWNAVRRDGSVDTDMWTYVQGEMIGARTLHYRLTNVARSLELAEGIASATLRAFGAFTHQPPSFNAMCFQALLLLSSLTSDASLRTSALRAVQGYADWAWDPASGARDPVTNLFHFAGDGAPARDAGLPATLQDQGAMLQVYSLLAWDAGNYSKLT